MLQANGGICPITGERVIGGEAVKSVLSLMHRLSFLVVFVIFFVFVFLSCVPNTHHSGQKYPQPNAQVAFSCRCLFVMSSSLISHHPSPKSDLHPLNFNSCGMFHYSEQFAF